MIHPIEMPPRPDGGWSDMVQTYHRAVVMPPVGTGLVQAAGVVTAQGDYVAQGALWRKHQAITTSPTLPGFVPYTLPGRWIWGGVMWPQFGAFLTESTSRLWAFDAVDGPVDGVVFISRGPQDEALLEPVQQAFFALMGLEVPVHVITAPTQVDELIVPGQGLGQGQISAGTDRARAQFAQRFAKGVQPEGPERLYISRSHMGVDPAGSVLGEAALERHLAAEGYEVFHPEDHPLEVQVARYRAARSVVATDGSALHVLALSMPQNQFLAVIARRQTKAVTLLERQLNAFLPIQPVTITALRRSWFPKGKRGIKRLALGELDLDAIGRQLHSYAYVSDGSWSNLSDAEVARSLAETGRDWYLKHWQRQLERD